MIRTVTLNARPGINGNNQADFRKAASELYDAARAVEKAMSAVNMNVTHGRNYQHIANFPDILREDDLGNTVYKMRKMIEMLEGFATDIIAVSRIGKE